MKALFKTLFAAFAALTLILSLSGCFEEGAKTASQGDSASSLASDSGKVKLVLKPGVRSFTLDFASKDARLEQWNIIQAVFKEKGVTIKSFNLSSVSGELFVSFNPLQEEMQIALKKNELNFIDVQGSLGRVATWDPSFGNEAKYSG